MRSECFWDKADVWFAVVLVVVVGGAVFAGFNREADRRDRFQVGEIVRVKLTGEKVQIIGTWPFDLYYCRLPEPRTREVVYPGMFWSSQHVETVTQIECRAFELERIPDLQDEVKEALGE